MKINTISTYVLVYLLTFSKWNLIVPVGAAGENQISGGSFRKSKKEKSKEQSGSTHSGSSETSKKKSGWSWSSFRRVAKTPTANDPDASADLTPGEPSTAAEGSMLSGGPHGSEPNGHLMASSFQGLLAGSQGIPIAGHGLTGSSHSLPKSGPYGIPSGGSESRSVKLFGSGSSVEGMKALGQSIPTSGYDSNDGEAYEDNEYGVLATSVSSHKTNEEGDATSGGHGPALGGTMVTKEENEQDLEDEGADSDEYNEAESGFSGGETSRILLSGLYPDNYVSGVVPGGESGTDADDSAHGMIAGRHGISTGGCHGLPTGGVYGMTSGGSGSTSGKLFGTGVCRESMATAGQGIASAEGGQAKAESGEPGSIAPADPEGSTASRSDEGASLTSVEAGDADSSGLHVTDGDADASASLSSGVANEAQSGSIEEESESTDPDSTAGEGLASNGAAETSTDADGTGSLASGKGSGTDVSRTGAPAGEGLTVALPADGNAGKTGEANEAEAGSSILEASESTDPGLASEEANKPEASTDFSADASASHVSGEGHSTNYASTDADGIAGLTSGLAAGGDAGSESAQNVDAKKKEAEDFFTDLNKVVNVLSQGIQGANDLNGLDSKMHDAAYELSVELSKFLKIL